MHTPGPQITLASGASVPAASGYAEGQPLFSVDAGALFHCVDVGGTNYWLGSVENVPFHADGTATTNPTQRAGWAPTASRKAVCVGYEGHYTQANDPSGGPSYYTISIKWKTATLDSFTTAVPAAFAEQTRVNGSINSIMDFSDLDGQADAGGLYTLNIEFSETGTQILRFAIGLQLREILE